MSASWKCQISEFLHSTKKFVTGRELYDTSDEGEAKGYRGDFALKVMDKKHIIPDKQGQPNEKEALDFKAIGFSQHNKVMLHILRLVFPFYPCSQIA